MVQRGLWMVQRGLWVVQWGLWMVQRGLWVVLEAYVKTLPLMLTYFSPAPLSIPH
jgi:hypothetical protein